MKREDFFRYFLLVILVTGVDLFGVLIGMKKVASLDYDHVSLSAALITILWAIRDGQKKGDHP